MLPCVGQGAIGIEIRENDDVLNELCQGLNVIHRGFRKNAVAQVENMAGCSRCAMQNILGPGASSEDRLAASFEPIIRELEGARKSSEAEALAALVDRIKNAN